MQHVFTGIDVLGGNRTLATAGVRYERNGVLFDGFARHLVLELGFRSERTKELVVRAKQLDYRNLMIEEQNDCSHGDHSKGQRGY